jgi:hypothetical protein
MSREEELTFLVRSVMRGGRPMTAREIVRELRRRARVTTNSESVIKVLRADQRHFVMRRPRFFQRSTRWQFIEAGPARDSGESGAPVPAWPLRPLLSGAAAVKLEFRRDEPPTNAVGRMT